MICYPQDLECDEVWQYHPSMVLWGLGYQVLEVIKHSDVFIRYKLNVTVSKCIIVIIFSLDIHTFVVCDFEESVSCNKTKALGYCFSPNISGEIFFYQN